MDPPHYCRVFQGDIIFIIGTYWCWNSEFRPPSTLHAAYWRLDMFLLPHTYETGQISSIPPLTKTLVQHKHNYAYKIMQFVSGEYSAFFCTMVFFLKELSSQTFLSQNKKSEILFGWPFGTTPGLIQSRDLLSFVTIFIQQAISRCLELTFQNVPQLDHFSGQTYVELTLLSDQKCWDLLHVLICTLPERVQVSLVKVYLIIKKQNHEYSS